MYRASTCWRRTSASKGFLGLGRPPSRTTPTMASSKPQPGAKHEKKDNSIARRSLLCRSGALAGGVVNGTRVGARCDMRSPKMTGGAAAAETATRRRARLRRSAADGDGTATRSSASAGFKYATFSKLARPRRGRGAAKSRRNGVLDGRGVSCGLFATTRCAMRGDVTSADAPAHLATTRRAGGSYDRRHPRKRMCASSWHRRLIVN